ncbi:class I SAM-dependent methyltransferase [Streptomyces sp. NBC_01205]|uniref:class I SAM-dependent methyltransferase n=1 Tax=Streptomyces sp. NBC_01205 TaxID=2903771 RepID=UPI002E0FADF3|nr:class I SAM-dependent methyltransferase [Streptomyces sp. NBC_01205]
MAPAELRSRVSGTSRKAWFDKSGRNIAAIVQDEVPRHHRPARVLDFGCGCGRVLRHLATSPGLELHAAEIQTDLLTWCRGNLQPVRYVNNLVEPPLPYEDDTFDLIYAISVFTHLPAPLHTRWLCELSRILGPDGRIVMTERGEAYTGQLNPEELHRLGSDGIAVRNERLPGTNACDTFVTRPWIEQEMRRAGLRLVRSYAADPRIRPRGRSRRDHPGQDLLIAEVNQHRQGATERSR